MSAAPFQLDFSPRRRGAARWARWLAWLALGLVAWGVVTLADHAAGRGGEVAVLQQRQESLQRKLNPLQARQAPPKPTPEDARRIELANGAIEKLSVPWAQLLQAFESVRVPRIGLLSLVPNAQERSVRLSGEARTVPDLMVYVARLSALPSLTHVHLVGYDTVLREGAQVVSFTLSATWQAR
jgi:hypothetical protein